MQFYPHYPPHSNTLEQVLIYRLVGFAVQVPSDEFYEVQFFLFKVHVHPDPRITE